MFSIKVLIKFESHSGMKFSFTCTGNREKLFPKILKLKKNYPPEYIEKSKIQYQS